MSRRRLVLLASLAAGLILARAVGAGKIPGTGSSGPDHVSPIAKAVGHGGETRIRPRSGESQSRPRGRPEPAKPAMRISPESFTITADDPGLQLLVTRNERRRVRDLTSQVAVDGRAAGLGRARARGLSPADRARASVTVTGDARRPGGDGADHARAAVEPLLGFCRGHRADLHPARLQHRRRATARPTARTASISRSSATTGPAIFRRWRATAASGGCRGWCPKRACFSPRRPARFPTAAAADLTVGSPEYQTLLAWVRDGAPEQPRQDARAASSRVGRARCRAVWRAGPAAAPGDGPLRRRPPARRDPAGDYRVNDDSAASVTPQGQATLLRRAETDLIVRYQSHVVSYAAVDGHQSRSRVRFRQAQAAQLHRRRAVQAARGAQGAPEPAGRRCRVSSPGLARPHRRAARPRRDPPIPRRQDPDKRTKLVDRLLARPEFVGFWRIKLGDLLQISAARQNNGAYRYQAWVDRCLKNNQPWDEVVRTLLTAVGDPTDIERAGRSTTRWTRSSPTCRPS